MLIESTKLRKEKTKKKEVKEANIAERSNKWYKKAFQYKESPFDLNNKKDSLMLSKSKEKLLK